MHECKSIDHDEILMTLLVLLIQGQKNSLTQETELLESLLQEVEHQVQLIYDIMTSLPVYIGMESWFQNRLVFRHNMYRNI